MIHSKEIKLLLCVFLTASMQNAGDKVQLDLWIQRTWTCIAESAGGPGEHAVDSGMACPRLHYWLSGV